MVLPQPSARFFEGLHLGAETETIESKCEIEVAIEQKTRGVYGSNVRSKSSIGLDSGQELLHTIPANPVSFIIRSPLIYTVPI